MEEVRSPARENMALRALPSCETPPPMAVVQVNGALNKVSPSGTAATNKERLVLGDVVEVVPRTWPGINKQGGVGKIVRINADGTYNVNYVLGGGEKRVERCFIKGTAKFARIPQREKKERDFFADYEQGCSPLPALSRRSSRSPCSASSGSAGPSSPAPSETSEHSFGPHTDKPQRLAAPPRPAERPAERPAAPAKRARPDGDATIGAADAPASPKRARPALGRADSPSSPAPRRPPSLAQRGPLGRPRSSKALKLDVAEPVPTKARKTVRFSLPAEAGAGRTSGVKLHSAFKAIAPAAEPPAVPKRTTRGPVFALLQQQAAERNELERKFGREHSELRRAVASQLCSPALQSWAPESRGRLEQLCAAINQFWRPIVRADEMTDKAVARLLEGSTAERRLAKLTKVMTERQRMEAQVLLLRQRRELMNLQVDLPVDALEAVEVSRATQD